jgi:hypothetical protein
VSAQARIRTLRHLGGVFLRWPPDSSFCRYVRFISGFGVAAAWSGGGAPSDATYLAVIGGGGDPDPPTAEW